jgi:hypothetical protein
VSRPIVASRIIVKYSVQPAIIARADLRLYIWVSLLMALFLGIGLAIGVRRADWSFAAGAVAMTPVLFALVAILRLEVSARGVSYRNLSGSRVLAFDELEKAYFTVAHSEATPQGVAVFWLQPRGGGPVKINLRTFPIKASAVLFAALGNHDIPIEVPDRWASRRMAHQIRDMQEKMFSKGELG